MIAYLEGKLVEKNPTLLILEVNGVGYCVNIPVSTYSNLGEIGQMVKVLTYQQVREDELKLFGFSTRPEKELFGLLISVNGVGPKVALSILSCIPVGEFQRSVLQEDLDALTSISGIGKKTAQRLIVELKEKLGKVDLGERKDLREEEAILTPAVDEAALALMSLGYTKVDARKALDKVTDQAKEALPVEELIKRVLKYTK
ncbi:MAG: Holliday junction branch migration protein RuvA [Candidatus Zixiibacteriota bacterium]|nr:MAG: Holliday junction branch migration protein RuvA [candidate division Zixibacteria bacterium]